ncbi:ATP-grasp domain-containing protein [Tautonia marina]|uniref:ATP-grasp domain-containing protein n=1 Tax=Tautonia marina TaxID=2653855 RepID=UPI001260C113|nr:RimK family alpha-L-glutamate ligase [Tautonia marina]
MPPHLVALVSGTGWHVQDLIRASQVVGCRLDPLPFPSLAARIGGGPARIEARQVNLLGVDGVLVRMMPPGSLEQVVYRMDALHRLEARGIPVLNPPRAVEAAVDKYLSLARLDAAGLPVPPTWVGESARDAMDAFHALGGDVVLKPLFGAEGRGLVRLSDPDLAQRAFRAMERIDAVLYVQQHIPNDGRDLRAFVLNGRVLGAIRRTALKGQWRTNVSLGGRAEALLLDPEAEHLALRAAQSVGARMAGVDLLPDSRTGRLVVLEVNAVPGWRALSAATGIDVAAALLDDLIRWHR